MKRIEGRENINTEQYWDKEYAAGKYDHQLNVRLTIVANVFLLIPVNHDFQ